MLAFFSVAVMTRAFPDETNEQKDLVLLQNISSYMLLACGLIYVISVSCRGSINYPKIELGSCFKIYFFVI